MRPSSCRRTNTSVTARDSCGSSVKRSRDQSTDSPSRRICALMVPPDCAFHCQTRSRKASRVRSVRRTPCAFSCRSTTICVAMPAWSVPGLPQHVVAAHAVITREGVHQRVLEGVPHVQRSGHVRRRDHDAIGRTVTAGCEPAVRFPTLVDAPLDLRRRVHLIHLNASRLFGGGGAEDYSGKGARDRGRVAGCARRARAA